MIHRIWKGAGKSVFFTALFSKLLFPALAENVFCGYGFRIA